MMKGGWWRGGRKGGEGGEWRVKEGWERGREVRGRNEGSKREK